MDVNPLCLNTSTIQPTPLLEKIHIAGRLGYDAIELWSREITDFEERGSLGELRHIISDSGLVVASIIGLEDWIDATDTARAENHRRIDQAAALGCPFIVASPPQQAVETNRAADAYAALLELGRSRKVRPALEFLGFVDGLSTLGSVLDVLEASGDTDACLVADVYHLLRGGGSLDDLLRARGSQIAIFHIDDMPAQPRFTEQTDFDRVMPGDGVVDLRRVMQHLKTIEYSGPLSLELFNKELWKQNPEDVCRKGLDRLRTLVDA